MQQRPTIDVGDDLPAGHRHSNFKVTLSTLTRPTDPAHEQQLADLLVRFQKERLRDLDAANRIFNFKSNEDRINISRGTPEKGDDPRGSRMHVHFSVKTTHAGSYYAPDIQRNMQEELKRYAAEQGVPIAGAYAHVQIDRSSYWENYSIKKNFGPSVLSGPSRGGFERLLNKELVALQRRQNSKKK